MAVLDIPDQRVKTGISHRYLRPSQAIVDPDLARTLPAEVVAATGLDVVCHAAESFLAKPYTSREKPSSPDERPPYQGSNPVADVWSAKALEYGGRFLRRAVSDPDDVEARGAMMLAASMAGVGFGSAGVHIPHACAYPIAGLKHEYQPPGYPGRPPVRPARHLGHRHGPRRVRVHVRRRPGTPPASRRVARRHRPARDPAGAHVRSGRPDPAASSATRRPTSRSSWRARWPRNASSPWHHETSVPRTSPRFCNPRSDSSQTRVDP